MRQRLRGYLRRGWFPAAIVLLYLYNFPYFAGINSANELPRIYLTMAIVDRGALNIDPELIEQAITPKTRAILPVHIFGASCDMDPIAEVAQRHGVSLRIAAYILAVDRVAKVHRLRGIYA